MPKRPGPGVSEPAKSVVECRSRPGAASAEDDNSARANCEDNVQWCHMSTEEAPPPWLWHLASRGLAVCALAVLVLAGALALGLADPPRAGPLLWQDDFKHGTRRWTLSPSAGGTLGAADGALVAAFTGSLGSEAPSAVGLTAAP